MSKTPNKKNNRWITVLVLILIFAPGILGTVAKVALSLLLPLGIIAAILVLIFKKDLFKGKNRENVQNAAGQAQETMHSAAENQQAQEEQLKTQADKELKKKLKRYSRSGLLMALAILCYVVAGFSGLGAAIAAVEAQGAAAATGDVMALTVVTLWFLGCGGVLHLISDQRRKRARDAFRYATMIGDRESYSLAKLSSATSYKIDKIRRDLDRMIDNGIFGELAYIDMANLCLMRTPDAQPDSPARQYSDYSRTMSSVGADVEQDASSVTGEKQTGTGDGDTDTSDFSAILAKIRRMDEEIRDEAVSERIRKIESITRNIFDYVKDNPEKMPQIRMFMNYYLPTTLKLLESYSRIERVGVAGQNMQEAKDNIEKILDMLSAGFQQQFDQLFKAESLDITSDIEVLEQMMKKDGLRENTDFVICEEKAEGSLHTFEDGYTDEISDSLDEEGGAAAQTSR